MEKYFLQIKTFRITEDRRQSGEAIQSIEDKDSLLWDSQIRPDGDEATCQDQAAADKMLRPEGLSEQNHPQYRSVNGEHIIEYHRPVRPDPTHPFVP